MNPTGSAGRATEVSPVRIPKPLLAASLTVLAAAVSVACFAQVV
ncbi:hypothetical protein PV341_12635 [Streptomyces sp. PA03-1a]|nr:hypothetical protein [Streptomyces sp. PA03-1a]MDX2814137.1 hypothetical protein [Streptomyces sp. PA03-5A]